MNALIELMQSEYERQDRGGIYGYFQRKLAYNSNRIEGSTLSEDDTASLFETRTISSSEGVIYRAKDIEEMTGHFEMFNQMLKTFEQPLSEELIKSYHYQLKNGVFEDRANGYNIGEYKGRRNTVGNLATSAPEEVHDRMSALLKEYHSQSGHSLRDLARFHADYELIHPFQDGNGRTGRMILFRESIKNELLPIIIHDADKAQYYQSLKEAQQKRNYDPLMDLMKTGQQKAYSEYQDYLTPAVRKLLNQASL